jgi:hypothetical protein
MARRTSNDPQAIANVLRLIPAKWLVGMLVALVLYFFLQPKLNAWFGWNLPSIAAMAGNETPAKPASPKPLRTRFSRQAVWRCADPPRPWAFMWNRCLSTI